MGTGISYVANIIIRDILWLARKRKNAEARTELLEVLFAETILPFAPTFLEEEIKKNLPEVALEHKLSINVLETHWEAYKKRITFVDMGGADCSYEDPKDAPYLKLQAELGYLILSKDTDIPRMGGRVAGTAVIARLRTSSSAFSAVRTAGFCWRTDFAKPHSMAISFRLRLAR